MSIYFAIVAIVCALFYPKYFIWRYKKYYTAFIKENYANRFGQSEILEVMNDCILSKDSTGEGKIFLTEIERIDETKNHFFLKITSGLSLIIPKNQLEQLNKFKTKLQEIGLTINDETNWVWK